MPPIHAPQQATAATESASSAAPSTTAASVALATSWSPPAGDADAYLDALQRLGAQALLLVASDAIPSDLPGLLSGLGKRRHELPVLAVEAILGALHLGQPRSFVTRPCALDRQEAQTAVTVTRAAMDLAVQLGARAVIVSLGSIGERGDSIERLWQTLHGKLRRGVLLYDDSAAQELRAVRAALAGRHLDAALRSLDPILEQATRRGLHVLLRNPARGLELPAGIELAAIRATFAGAPLSSLLDLPAAHFSSLLHLLPLRETILAFADAPAAAAPLEGAATPRSSYAMANLADACGALSGLLPGQGEAQPARVARALSPATQRLFVPWSQLSESDVARGLRSIASL